ncbi:MAG: hypothetical protein U0411_04340 [Thermodesulfovibrionales bacterium]
MITRRDFLRFCEASTDAVSLDAGDLSELRDALVRHATPVGIRLRGSMCAGCSGSLLNRIASPAPESADEVLVASLNADVHPTFLALAGGAEREAVRKAYAGRGYILLVEGGIPVGRGGDAIWAWDYDAKGPYVAFREAVEDLSGHASAVVCVGTCAAWGGVPSLQPAPANPTLLKGVGEVTGKTTINIGGCPAKEESVAWTVVQLLLGREIPLDPFGRPAALCNGKARELASRLSP